MADYYPLIARAVAGLDKNTGDARRALYERARAALVAQLRGVTPALDESDVTRERLALEEAIRKVEGESARQTTVRVDPNRVKAPEFPRWQEPEPAPEPAPEFDLDLGLEAEPEEAPEPPRVPPRRVPPPPRQDARQEGRQDTRQDARQETRPDGRPAVPGARPRTERVVEGREATQSDRFEARRPSGALRGERPERERQETRQEARKENRQEARQEGRPPVPPPGRSRTEPRRSYQEPEYEEAEETDLEGEPPPPRNSGNAGRARDERGDRRSSVNSNFQEFREVVSEADELGGASARAKRSAREKFAAVPNAKRPRSRDPDADEAYLTLDDIAEQPVMLEPSFVVDESRPVPPRGRSAQQQPPDAERGLVPRRSYAGLIRIAIAVVLVGLIVSLVIWQLPNLEELYASLTAPAQPTEQTNDNTPTTPQQRKMTDRIEPGGKSLPPQGDVANVAQHVMLYEEDPSVPSGKSAPGSVSWSTEAVSPGSGKSPELQVRANITIPDRGMVITWVFHRDTEPGSSSSHTIEINFKLPPNFPSGGINKVPGIYMKQAEQIQGTALDGISVPVTTNYFLIGLSALPSSRERNVKLLKEMPWIEIPIVYANNQRAILAIEKGPPGDQAFANAFAAWEK
jgi:hypothetical protein